jgi:hypothetical protein
VGERAPAVGAASADASLAQQRAERAGEARAMLGKKGAPSLFKFGFKVVPRAEAAARASARLAVQREQRADEAEAAEVELAAATEERLVVNNVGWGMHQGVRCAGLWAA